MDPQSVQIILDVADQAGRAVLSARAKGISVQAKADGSPVTTADLESERILTAGLRRHFPQIPIVSEETPATQTSVGSPPCFFLIDPLDGTREFIAGRDEFTINVALVEGRYPTLGIIGAPAIGRSFAGLAGVGAFERKNGGPLAMIGCKVKSSGNSIVVLVSRSHLDAATRDALSKLPAHALREMGSSLKFALVGTGEADLYARLAPTMGWDTAAGQAIVETAGGIVLAMDGSRLGYSLSSGLRNPGFVASTKLEYARMIVPGETTAPCG